MGGVSLLVIERSKGVKTTQMKCSGVWPSGTTYVEFDDVLVPVENLIGKENQGFKYIMYNFVSTNQQQKQHQQRMVCRCFCRHPLTILVLCLNPFLLLVCECRITNGEFFFCTIPGVELIDHLLLLVADSSFSCLCVCAVSVSHCSWGMATQAISFARVCVSEAMKHAFKRKTFGKVNSTNGQRRNRRTSKTVVLGGRCSCCYRVDRF